MISPGTLWVKASVKLLTVDTSTATCSVALSVAGQTRAEYLVECQRTLSERLLAATETILLDTGLSLDDLDGFGVALGPGSFTGVRIGVATVKGLAIATGKPVVGFSSLALLAMNLPFSSFPVCPMYDARKSEVYAGIYRCDPLPTAVVSDAVIAPERLLARVSGTTIFLGEGALRYRGLIEELVGDWAIFAPPGCHQPRAAAGAVLALEQFRAGNTIPLPLLNPAYIRPSEAELAKLRRETL